MRYTEQQFRVVCNCRSVGECSCNSMVWKKALDKCVDAFADEIKRKLVRKYLEGKDGWDDPEWPREDILKQLRDHIDKGDMLDVAAFAMFAWNQGDSYTTSKPCDSAPNQGTSQVNRKP